LRVDALETSIPEPADRAAARRRDLRLILSARAARNFGDGFAVIILPAYLTAIGYSPAQFGVVATTALLGSALLTLSVGWLAPRFDLRSLLIAGASLMAATGLAMPNAQHLALILLIAFIGTMNPATGDMGVLVPIEHTVLAREAADADRTKVFARYSLVGAIATSGGALAAATPDLLRALGVAPLPALQAMLYLYAVLGLAGIVCYRALPRADHGDAKPPSAPLRESRRVVFKLAALFSVDAFAGGFIVQSLLALWLFERFGLSLSAASTFFFGASVLAAFSFPAAAWLARRIGLINTMVYTHVPSSLCVIAAAFAPNLTIVLALLLVRAALSQMDVPTRTSYVMAVVTPAERPAAASVTTVPRSLASSVSPALAGLMLGTPYASLPLVICGVLKIAYDAALLLSFRHIKPPEERESA
jgi:MFS family permease